MSLGSSPDSFFNVQTSKNKFQRLSFFPDTNFVKLQILYFIGFFPKEGDGDFCVKVNHTFFGRISDEDENSRPGTERSQKFHYAGRIFFPKHFARASVYNSQKFFFPTKYQRFVFPRVTALLAPWLHRPSLLAHIFLSLKR